MNRCATKSFVSIGIAVTLFLLFPSLSWSSPLQFLYPEEAIYVNLGIYAEIEGSWESFSGDIPNYGTYITSDWRSCDASGTAPMYEVGYRSASDYWEMSYQLTNTGFSINSHMTLTTSYSYSSPPEWMDPGYAVAIAGWGGGGFYDALQITPTPQTPAGTIMSFAIQTKTSGTPWGHLEWTFTLNGITVNQSNYDQVIFDLVVGDVYYCTFKMPEGLQTQRLVDGSLVSDFDFYFSQVPVPIPGAIWLLGSGLVGVIGLRRKYWN